MESKWPLAKLGKLLRHRKNFIVIDDLATYKRVTAKLHAKGIVLRDEIEGSMLRTKKQQVCKAGDFLVAEIDAKVGGFGIIPLELGGAIVSSHYFLFEINEEELERMYLNCFIKTDDFQNQIEARGSTNYAAIRPEDVLHLEIPLPPLEEQKRIVAKTTNLIAMIERAKKLRDESFKEIEKLLSEKKSEIFKKASQEWKNEHLHKIVSINMGQSPPGHSYNSFGEGVPLLNGPTEFGKTFPKEVKWTTSPTKICRKGDILVCVRGATTGKMNWADKEYCIGRGLAALTPDSKLSIPEYVYYFLEVRTHIMLSLASGSTFPNLSRAKLRKLVIPIPPLHEQRRIVAYLDSFERKANELKKLQVETKKEIKELIPSILEKAFKGEL